MAVCGRGRVTSLHLQVPSGSALLPASVNLKPAQGEQQVDSYLNPQCSVVLRWTNKDISIVNVVIRYDVCMTIKSLESVLNKMDIPHPGGRGHCGQAKVVKTKTVEICQEVARPHLERQMCLQLPDERPFLRR